MNLYRLLRPHCAKWPGCWENPCPRESLLGPATGLLPQRWIQKPPLPGTARSKGAATDCAGLQSPCTGRSPSGMPSRSTMHHRRYSSGSYRRFGDVEGFTESFPRGAWYTGPRNQSNRRISISSIRHCLGLSGILSHEERDMPYDAYILRRAAGTTCSSSQSEPRASCSEGRTEWDGAYANKAQMSSCGEDPVSAVCSKAGSSA